VSLSGEAFLMPTYRRYPVTLVRGQGMEVFDDEGRSYLDFAAAIGAMPLGHGHPHWRKAVAEQLDALTLVSNLWATPPQAELAQRLVGLLPIEDGRVFFSNSGAEANEAALKIVRRWGLPRGRRKIVALQGSFHGRTIATLAATGQPAKRAAFEPLLDWFEHVPPGDLGAMERAIDEETAAVFLEPVMGEGGVVPLEHGFLRGVRELTAEREVLLVADEVQSGVGRCGDWLASTLSGVVPDAVSLAKGLGGGLPIGATVARSEIAFGPGDHASTFGGGPVVCAAALATLEVIEGSGLLENARTQGGRLQSELQLAAGGTLISQVRGRGLLVGIRLAQDVAHHVALAALEQGLLVTEAGPDVVRLSPPLIVAPEEIDRAVEILIAAVEKVAGRLGETA
jgi:acetylornithine aminotransferase